MSEPTREELERALKDALNMVKYAAGFSLSRENPYSCCEAVDVMAKLADCVPVPKNELARYERALWALMLDYGYPDLVAAGRDAMWIGIGFADASGSIIPKLMLSWTLAAHEFARRMREKGGA